MMSSAPESLAIGQVVAYVLLDLAIILVAARLLGALAVRLRQPRLVGELVAGVLVGPTLLGGQIARSEISELDRPAVAGDGLVNDLFPLQSFEFLNIAATLAMVLFMFMLGLEAHGRFLRRRALPAGVVAIALVAVPVAIGFLVASILDSPGEWKLNSTPEGRPIPFPTHALFLGAAMATVAFPLVARVLQRKRVIGTPLGALSLGAAIAATPLMVIIVATASLSIRQQGVPDSVAIKVAAAAGFVVFLFVVVRPGLRILLNRYFRPEERLGNEILGALMIGTVLSALASQRIGMHALVGAFVFGACVPRIDGLSQAVLGRVRQPIVVLGVPVFLAVIGLQTDFRNLNGELLAGVALVVAALIVGKLATGAVSGRAAGLSWREASALGALANDRGLLILVVALIGLQTGVVAPLMAVALVSGALVTTAMTGPLTNWLIPADTVEVRLERTIKRALAGASSAWGENRIVVVPVAESSAPAAIAAALDHVDDDPPPGFLVISIPGLPPNGEYVGAGPAETRAVVDEARHTLELGAEVLRAADAEVAMVVFQSPTPEADLTRLAQDWSASRAIVGGRREADALATAGVQVERVASAAI